MSEKLWITAQCLPHWDLSWTRICRRWSCKRVFSKKEIYDYAWDDLYIGEDRTINVHVSNIRQKIKAFSDKEYIETVWGVGFKLAD